MPTLPNMGIITPTLGGDKGVWDDKINAAMGLIDAHDHTAGKGLPITTAALDIDADLDVGGHALTSLGKITFSAIATLAAGLLDIYVDVNDNELYWRNASGANVKLTSGNSINTSLVGGIVGDYSTVGAEVAFDDANHRYTFKQQGSPHTWAITASGEVRIYETSTSENVYVGQKAPTALAATYTLTWPLALPAVGQPVVCAADGTLTFGQAITLNVDQGVTISGTARYGEGSKPTIVPLLKTSCYAKLGAASDAGPGITLSNNSEIYIPLPPVPNHRRVLNVSLYFDSNADAAACTCELVKSSAALPSVAGFTSTAVFLTGATSKLTASGINFQSTSGNNAQTLWVKVTNSLTTPRIAALAYDSDVP